MSGTIVLRQQGQVHEMCSGEDIPMGLAPQWDYVSPTPDMESRGLTPTVLREIVDGINEKSKEHFRENFPQKACKGKIRWIQLGVLLLGALIMIDANSSQILSEQNCYTSFRGYE